MLVLFYVATVFTGFGPDSIQITVDHSTFCTADPGVKLYNDGDGSWSATADDLNKEVRCYTDPKFDQVYIENADGDSSFCASPVWESYNGTTQCAWGGLTWTPTMHEGATYLEGYAVDLDECPCVRGSCDSRRRCMCDKGAWGTYCEKVEGTSRYLAPLHTFMGVLFTLGMMYIYHEISHRREQKIDIETGHPYETMS